MTVLWNAALAANVAIWIALFFIVWKGLVKNPPTGTK